MRYLLLILFHIILFSSCTESIKPVENPKSLELQYSEAQKDTMLVLVVDHTIMIFDKNNQQVYEVTKVDSALGVLLGVLLGFLLGVMLTTIFVL